MKQKYFINPYTNRVIRFEKSKEFYNYAEIQDIENHELKTENMKPNKSQITIACIFVTLLIFVILCVVTFLELIVKSFNN